MKWVARFFIQGLAISRSVGASGPPGAQPRRTARSRGLTTAKVRPREVTWPMAGGFRRRHPLTCCEDDGVIDRAERRSARCTARRRNSSWLGSTLPRWRRVTAAMSHAVFGPIW